MRCATDQTNKGRTPVGRIAEDMGPVGIEPTISTL
jgi:hypothetical protein